MEQLGTLKAAEILLVEDSPTDRLLAIEALKSSGLMNSLSVVDNGVDAMHYLRKEGRFAGAKRPDLVLLDLNLPKKGGHEVLAEVESDPRLMYIPVIVLTTSRSDEDLLRAYGHHANGYITKPVNRGNAELLGEAEGLYAAKELAIEIQDAATRAGVIARQLLSFSRQQSQQPQVVDLTRQIDEFIPLVRRLLGDAVKLELDLAHDLPLVRVAPGMLDQVLLNLAINARDAMAHGGTFSVRTLAVELDEYAAERYRGGYPGVFVKLIVSDTGKGMPPEVLSRVFDPFFTTKAIEQGTGLGLSLVQGIVQQHRGWLDVASRVGEGTDFQIFIPATTQKIVQRSTRPPALRPSSGATILFVEEDVSLRLLATRVLKGHGYGVLEAGSEMEALSVWREHAANIDLVITEMCLPEGQTGTRLAAALARTRPAVQFIFASSCATQSGLNESGASDVTFEEGVDFLQKPYAMSSLIDIVEQRLPALPSA
jgi:two-component system, cell cycle sensor histidine kinase and response regulator CckA